MSRAVCLALVVVVIMGVGMSAPTQARPGSPLSLPAGAEPTTETLLDATVDALPTGFAVVGLVRWALPPSTPPLIVPPHGGPVVVVVEGGELIANQNGVETPLAAGQMYAPKDYAREITLHASGPDEAILFVAAFTTLEFQTCEWGYDPLSSTRQELIQTPTEALPGGSGRLVLERLTVPPGRSLHPYEASPLIWAGIAEGVLGLTLDGQMPPFWDPGQERSVYPRQPWPRLPVPTANPLMAAGTRITLRNAGDAPLALYRLTLVSRDGSPGDLGPLRSERPRA